MSGTQPSGDRALERIADFLVFNEAQIRSGFFVATLVLCLGLESMFPRRPWSGGRFRRSAIHLLLTFGNSLLLRFAVPLLAVGTALFASEQKIGLFNWLRLPIPLSFFLSLVILDLVIYAQHVAVHKVPVLWRIHRVHHTDTEFDTTTALRFHPFEILLSMILKMAVVAAIGAPVAAVLVYEILLSTVALFSHANLSIRPDLERIIRRLIITPDMHRVHHSVRPAETDSNFGNVLSLWDRLFGTYRAMPAAGHDAMEIGLAEWRSLPMTASPFFILALPFMPVVPEPTKGRAT